MIHEKTKGGGIRLELNASETSLFRHVIERAAFIDTPPEEQHAILRLAEKILAALGSGDRS